MISELLARWVRVAALLASAAVASACSGSTDVVPPLWLGHPGDKIAASTASSVFWVQADVDGDPGPQTVVDTGAPITLLHVDAFNGAVPLGVGRVATLTLGVTTFWQVPTVGDKSPNSFAPNGGLDGGIVGFTVFGQFAVSFNYRDRQVIFGAAPVPEGVLPPVEIPFTLAGGGKGTVSGGAVIRFSASRVILPVTVEGRNLKMLLDTGSSWVGLRSNIYESIVADGRAQVSVQALLANGMTVTKVTRLRSVSLAGVEVTRPVSASAVVLDGLMDSLSNEVDQQVDGLLGAPFLHNFYVTVDYPNQKLFLYRYADSSLVIDDYQKVGIEFSASRAPTGTSYVVERVYDGTDAARQGIRVKDSLIAIDGVPLSDLDPATVDRLLHGAVGATRKLQLADRTVDVLVDDLLPLP